MDVLSSKSITLTGTIMNKMVPKEAQKELENAKGMKKEGRGAVNQVVREDNKVCVVQWFDNKEVLSVSNESGAFPCYTCRRWSKEDPAFINVPRPVLIKQYNEKMGGVDLSDRKKWTIRTILHMLDLCLSNSWVQERMERKAVGKNKKELMGFLDFRLSIGESLLEGHSVSSEESDFEDNQPGPSKRVSLPSEGLRKHKAAHLPRMMDLKNAARCRNPSCKQGKSRLMCTACNVYLCIRGCFEEFHK